MTTSRDSFPDIARPDADIALISAWTVDISERQRAAAETAIPGQKHEAWPDGLLSDTYFVEIDGDTVLHYSQWTSEEAAAGFARSDRPEWAGRIDAIPDSETHGSTPYRLYRSFVPDGSPRRRGCIVAISFETDSSEWQRKLVDWLADRLPANPPHPGNIANHFHLSTGGTRVFNYTEWTDAEAHRDVIENSLHKESEILQMIDDMTGVRGLGYKRYNLHRSLATTR